VNNPTQYPTDDVSKLLLKAEDVARKLSLGRATVYATMDSDELPRQNASSCVPEPSRNSAALHDEDEVAANSSDALLPIELKPESLDDGPHCGMVIGQKSIAAVCQRCYWKKSNHQRRFDGKRAAVIERDGGCRVCRKSFDLIVHHRQPGQDHPALLVTLCRPCHARVHRLEALYAYEDALFLELWAEQHPTYWKQQQFDFEDVSEPVSAPRYPGPSRSVEGFQ